MNLLKKMAQSTGTLNQVLSLLTVASNEFTNGIANGWVAPTLNSLQNPNNEFHVTLEESSWIVSLDQFGKIFGAIFTAFVLDIVGRRILLTSSALVLFLMWVVIMFTRSVPILCSLRLIFGFFIGINDSTNSIYLAENSSPKIRSVFGAVCITVYYIGLLAEYAIAPYFSYTTVSIINAVITFLTFLSVFWMKEPVQYLLMKGKIEQAERNFTWLHVGDLENEKIKSEFEQIQKNVNLENLKKSSFKKTFTSRANYKSLSIVIPLYALVGCTGYFPVMSYATLAFSSSSTLTPDEFTVLFGIVQFLVIVPTSFFIGRFNRRRIILFFFSLISLCHAVTATLYYSNSQGFKIPYFSWLIFSSITIYAGINAAMYPVVFIIRGELFPLSVKATGGCLLVISWSATSFLTAKIFLYVSKGFGIEVNFFIFFVFSIVTLVFVYFCLPETKNKTLIEIQEMLEIN